MKKGRSGKLSGKSVTVIACSKRFYINLFNWSLLPLPYLIIGTGKKVRTDVFLWVAFNVHSQVTQ